MRTLAAALLLLGLAAAARAQDPAPSPAPARKHAADPRALELVRKADRAMYRPTDAGLKTLRCRAQYRMTNGTVHEMAYVMESPGKSTLALRTSESGAKGTWDDDERERYESILDGLFDGPRLERELEPCTLEVREVGGAEVVIARRAGDEKSGDDYRELRFLPEGPLAEDSPGEESVRKGISVRQRFTYDPEGALYRRKRATLDGYGKGFLHWKYETTGGILMPVSFNSWLSGLGGTLTISEVEVNAPIAGPATLPEPAAPPSQAELDALDVDALVAKLRPPFVGSSPNPVTAVRAVRALSKKGGDAKRAIPTLVMLLAFDRSDEPQGDARPADYGDFRVAASKLLAELRPESIPPLVAALKSPNTEQRAGAARSLGFMGRDARDATDALLAALDDETWQVAIEASVALRKIGCPAGKALPALLRKASVWWMGEAFAEEAVEFAKSEPGGDRELVLAFVSGGFTIEREADGRRRGLELLFAKHGAPLVSALAEAAKDGDLPARERIACALACVGRPAFVVLGGWIDGDDAGLRRAALRGVHWAGKDAEALVPKIAALLASTDDGVAYAAEETLIRVGAPAIAGVEEFIASRTEGDAARERARRILERVRPAK